MSRDIAELFREASELPENDRAELAGRLLQTLERGPDEAVDVARAQQILKRDRQLDFSEAKTIARAEARAKLRRFLLERECAKLDPVAEQALANESYVADTEWPDY
jgi:hypothetical protein